jgi:hypothetical protein
MNTQRCRHLNNNEICDFFENTSSLKDLKEISNNIKQSYFNFREKIDIKKPKFGIAWSSANCPFLLLFG